jgi:hypothetical protein
MDGYRHPTVKMNISIDEIADMAIEEIYKKLNINKVICIYDHVTSDTIKGVRRDICHYITQGWHLYGQMFRDEDNWWVQPMVKYDM